MYAFFIFLLKIVVEHVSILTENSQDVGNNQSA